MCPGRKPHLSSHLGHPAGRPPPTPPRLPTSHLPWSQSVSECLLPLLMGTGPMDVPGTAGPPFGWSSGWRSWPRLFSLFLETCSPQGTQELRRPPGPLGSKASDCPPAAGPLLCPPTAPSAPSHLLSPLWGHSGAARTFLAAALWSAMWREGEPVPCSLQSIPWDCSGSSLLGGLGPSS